MTQAAGKPEGMSIGSDTGGRKTHFHVLRRGGETYGEGNIPANPRKIRGVLESHGKSLVVLEVGTHSPWIQRIAEALGHRTLVADPRLLRLLRGNEKKTDSADALYLARPGRLDTELSAPIHACHPPDSSGPGRFRGRDRIVKQRGELISKWGGPG